MKNLFRGISLGVWLALLAPASHAVIRKVRITEFPDNKNYAELWNIVNRSLGSSFDNTQFGIAETVSQRNMTFMHLAQVRAGAPIEGASMRLWIDEEGGMIVAEGYLDVDSNKSASRRLTNALADRLAPAYLNDADQLHNQEVQVRMVIGEHADGAVAEFQHEDRWKGADFQRVFTGLGKRGTHTVRFSHARQAVIEHSYKPFASADELEPVEAVAFKVWEENPENNTELMDAEPVMLKYLNAKTVAHGADPLGPVAGKEYSLYTNSEMLVRMGLSPEFGTWSFAGLEQEINGLMAQVPVLDNGFGGPAGLVLDGRFVNVTVHPEAKASAAAEGAWLYAKFYSAKQGNGLAGPTLKFSSNGRGKTFRAATELTATPVRHPQHAVSEALKTGTDQIQVYWAVTEMMEKLQGFGFTDQDISTRPFEAILFDPDQSFRNNAYYINNTLNFTTYSADKGNMARDNTTIWHELGHGIVDRIMGPALVMARSAGFNEGISDFLAELILQATSFQRDFAGREQQRIYNNKPFNMYNDVHTAGEAFGGTMKGILDRAITEWGEEGVAKMADLLLETMRFTRNHPALDEQEWFEKLRFVDSRESDVRAAGGFAPLISAALAGRNFSANRQDWARFDVEIDGRILADDSSSQAATFAQTMGSARSLPVKVTIADGADYRFNYPLRVVVESALGPLMGIKWDNEAAEPKKELAVHTSGDTVEVTLAHQGQCDLLFPGANGCGDGLSIKVYEPLTVKPVVYKTARFTMMPAAAFPFPLSRR